MEQIRNLDQLLVYAKEVGPKKISVACAEDAEVMEAVENARKAGIANAFLVGNADKIKEVTDKLGIDLANYEIVDERGGEAAAALKAVELVSSGEAQIVMKGMVATANFLRGVLNKEKSAAQTLCPALRLTGNTPSGARPFSLSWGSVLPVKSLSCL